MNENIDEWLFCGVLCDVFRVWWCNEMLYERLFFFVDCIEFKEIGKLSIMEFFVYSGILFYLFIYMVIFFDLMESFVFYYKKILLMC